MVHEFRAHPIYYALAGGTLLLLMLLGWDLWQNPTAGAFLFVAIVLVAMLWFVFALDVHVALAPSELTVHRSYSRAFTGFTQPAPETIAYRQLISAEPSGRFLSTLTLLYYPMQSDGLLDLEQVASTTLPLMTNQSDLLERLEAVIPQ